jgi:hypothetical protein
VVRKRRPPIQSVSQARVAAEISKISSHPPHCFKAITKGVFGHLTSLTSLTDKSRYKSTKTLYPRHSEALNLAGLSPKYVLALQEILELNKGKEKCKEGKLERDKQRNVHKFQ